MDYFTEDDFPWEQVELPGDAPAPARGNPTPPPPWGPQDEPVVRIGDSTYVGHGEYMDKKVVKLRQQCVTRLVELVFGVF